MQYMGWERSWDKSRELFLEEIDGPKSNLAIPRPIGSDREQIGGCQRQGVEGGRIW